MHIKVVGGSHNEGTEGSDEMENTEKSLICIPSVPSYSIIYFYFFTVGTMHMIHAYLRKHGIVG